MTDTDIAAIRARLAAAPDKLMVYYGTDIYFEDADRPLRPGELVCEMNDPELAALFVHARPDLAALLAERDALQKENDRLDRLADEAWAECDRLKHQAEQDRINRRAAENAMYCAMQRERDLRAALEPFAALCEAVDQPRPLGPRSDDSAVYAFNNVALTLGALRRARAALEGRE